MITDIKHLSSDPLILLIGNFDLELKSVISILSEANYQFIKAPTFESGLNQLKMPDLILIESSQLEQNGIHFFSKIKADPKARLTPVIVISASLVSSEKKYQIIQQGAASFLCLPVNPFELLSVIFAELRNLSEIAALKTSEHQLAELVRLSPVPTVVYSGPEHRYSRVNNAHDLMVGKKVEGMTIREAYTNAESGKVPEILDAVERSGEAFVSKETPYSIKGDDGKSRPLWVHEWFYPFLNSNGQVTSILGMAQDVTEQVQARHEASSVLDSLPAFITRMDLNERFIFINQSSEKYFGPPENILGKTMREYFGSNYDEFKDKVASALSGTAVEFEWSSVPMADSLVHHFIVSFTPEWNSDGKVKGFITCLFNIDPLKKSEDALRMTQEHLGLALEAGQMGTWQVDLKTQNLTGSPHLLEIHGINELPRDLATAINLTVHPDDRDALTETLAACVKDHTSFEHHYRIIRPSDGAIRWLDGRGKAKYNDDGEANCLIGIMSDITEQKLLQLEAERARQELHNFFMQAPIPLVILTGPDHLFTLANAPYEKLVGRKVVGKTVREAFSDKIVNDFVPVLDKVYQTGITFTGNELPIQFPDEHGKETDYWINEGYQPARDDHGDIIGLFAIIHDVTEQVLARKNLENSETRLLQSQSMIKTMRQIAENERAKLASVFAQTPNAIAVFEGPDHVFTMANPSYVTQFFGGRQDLIGQSVRTAVPEAVEQGFEELLNTVFRTGEPYIGTEMPIDLLQADGKERTFHLNLVYQPLRDTSGKITGIVAVITDVTDQVSTRIKLQEGEAQLIKNQEMLTTTVRVARVGFCDWNIQKNSFTCSDQFRNDWGVESLSSLEEAFARIHPDDREKTSQLVDKSISDRTPYFAEYRVVRPDGRTIWIEAQAVVDYKSDGTPIRFYGTTIDISARKAAEFQLQFEKHKLETVFMDSPAAMAMWQGSELIFEKVNPNFQSIFGNRQLIGKSLLQAIPELKGQAFYDMLKMVFETGETAVAHEMLAKIVRKKDGPLEDRYFDFTYVRINDPDGNPYGVYDHAVDVTDRVVGRMQLQVAKSEAEKANQTKSSFLANMSHEIRTPLGAILGFTDLLKDTKLSFDERNQFLDTILRNGKALTTIIDDILDLAKVESGKLDIENLNFSLLDLIDDVMDVFRERTRSKNIFLRAHISKETPNRVFSDPSRIRQILINVVGNAVKFTASGGVTIEVSASENSREKTQFTILVKDTGVGLTTEQKERLFQPFMQADNSTTRKYGGTGLGLALSKRLATALGGDIFIEDTAAAQSGCTFGFTFAASVSKQVANEVKIKDVTEKNKEKNIQLLLGIRVLLAEDSIDNQLLVRLVLTKQGATVDTANNGVEAVRMGMDGNYDIVLMDIQMPEMDGFEATHSLREAGFKKPIVALTAHAMPEERARTLAAGCNEHLTKPLNQIELIETIERLTSYNKNTIDPRKDH